MIFPEKNEFTSKTIEIINPQIWFILHTKQVFQVYKRSYLINIGRCGNSSFITFLSMSVFTQLIICENPNFFITPLFYRRDSHPLSCATLSRLPFCSFSSYSTGKLLLLQHALFHNLLHAYIFDVVGCILFATEQSPRSASMQFLLELSNPKKNWLNQFLLFLLALSFSLHFPLPQISAVASSRSDYPTFDSTS